MSKKITSTRIYVPLRTRPVGVEMTSSDNEFKLARRHTITDFYLFFWSIHVHEKLPSLAWLGMHHLNSYSFIRNNARETHWLWQVDIRYQGRQTDTLIVGFLQSTKIPFMHHLSKYHLCSKVDDASIFLKLRRLSNLIWHHDAQARSSTYDISDKVSPDELCTQRDTCQPNVR